MPYRGRASTHAAPYSQQQDGGVWSGKDRGAGHSWAQKFLHHGKQVRVTQRSSLFVAGNAEDEVLIC